jgi:glycosyltransferase involved in cell wall biosynthesis
VCDLQEELVILGVRGVPAAHGGFETFAENLSVYLVDKGWRVTVYCQVNPNEPLPPNDHWNGVRRIFIPTSLDGAVGTVQFDWRSTIDAIKVGSTLVLTLGYNTALFGGLLRLKGIKNVINMDGIEWSRAKWGPLQKAWLWMNERFGCWFGNHLIADHPEIKRYLAKKISADKITTIPYGAHTVKDADLNVLTNFSLKPRCYAILIARPEPENSILEIVRAFSTKKRNCCLVVLGKYDAEKSAYQRSVVEAASAEVRFLGAIYDRSIVESLRMGALLYVHGHTVGGTNPSLVEAMGSGSAVLAHQNAFNQWVAGDEAAYFADESSCAAEFDRLLSDEAALQKMSEASRLRHEERFQWSQILSSYEGLLQTWLPKERSVGSSEESARNDQKRPKEMAPK